MCAVYGCAGFGCLAEGGNSGHQKTCFPSIVGCLVFFALIEAGFSFAVLCDSVKWHWMITSGGNQKPTLGDICMRTLAMMYLELLLSGEKLRFAKNRN